MTTIRYAARSADELANREVQATKLGAVSSALAASFLTDPDILASVLPPPLSPPDRPEVKVSISRVDLPGIGPFGAGTFAVAAKHGDVEGFYPLLMPMSTEQAVTGGRETFGEPKKLAKVTQEREGDHIVARVNRLGTTIIEIDGTVGAALERPVDATRIDFYLKFLMDPSGKGLDHDASLVYCHRATETSSHHAVDGTLTLRDSRFDPVADFPILGEVTLTLSERRSSQIGEIVATVPADAVAPFAHQRYDDMHPAGKSQ